MGGKGVKEGEGGERGWRESVLIGWIGCIK